jgi:hypothetical protein
MTSICLPAPMRSSLVHSANIVTLDEAVPVVLRAHELETPRQSIPEPKRE